MFGFLAIFVFSLVIGTLMGAVLAWIARRKGRRAFVWGFVFGAFISIGMVVPTVHDILDLGLVGIGWRDLPSFLLYFPPFDSNMLHRELLTTSYLSIAAWLCALVYLLVAPAKSGQSPDVVPNSASFKPSLEISPKITPQDLIVQRNLRPLGNKKRLVFDEENGCLDYRAQFRDKASAERYYEAFVRFAEHNPPPVLIEVMVAYTPNTIYSEKYSFILPYFDSGREDYQKWAREVMFHCNDIQRQHSCCSGNDYSYVSGSISSKWTILPPRGFDPDSPEAQELLTDPPGMGFDTVIIEGQGNVIPNKPEPQGPSIGVLFDISKFDEAWYGRAATKQLLDIVGVQKLSGCVIHGGDLLPDGKYWCSAIHAASQEQADLIETSVINSNNAKLAQDRGQIIRGEQVPFSTLPYQGFVSKEGVYVGN